jgi:tetratricopeptide (TPR) repeat protein
MSHFLINKLPVTTHLKRQRWDKFGFLVGNMKNTVNKSTGIILPIVLFFLFSYASAQQKQDEPKDAKSYIDRGIAYGEKGQYDQAISDYNKALEIDPRSAGAYYNRGLAYAKEGKYGQAISDFTDALKINPKDPYTYYNRGLAYVEKDQSDQAIDDFTKVLEIEPKAAGAYYYRGIGYVDKGKFGWAIDDFTKVLEMDPKSAGVYYYRATAYYFGKDYDKSWKDIKKAQDFGYKIPSKFLENLRKASGRQN